MNPKLESPIKTNKDVLTLEKISIEAGKILLSYYKKNKDQQVSIKNDQSVVTMADLSANDYIIEKLQEFFPNVSIVSEENSFEDNLTACKDGHYFMIDPLDGTSGFVKNSDEFTVNIAYIENFSVSFGMIYLPVQEQLYYTSTDKKSFLKDLKSNTEAQIHASCKTTNLQVIATKREPEKSTIVSELDQQKISINEFISISSSYKFCLMADGSADLYPRRANISAWDIAAGHAIVECANGHLLNVNGTPIRYQFEKNFKIPFFNVFGQHKIL